VGRVLDRGGGQLPEAVTLILGHQPAPAFRDGSILHNLDETDVVEEYPNEVADMLLHLLVDDGEAKFQLYGVQSVVKKLKLAGGKADKLRKLVDRLSKIGVADAGEITSPS